MQVKVALKGPFNTQLVHLTTAIGAQEKCRTSCLWVNFTSFFGSVEMIRIGRISEIHREY